MTNEEIKKDREARSIGCKAQLEEVLKKWSFALIAEDYLTPNTKVNVQIQFLDLMKYDAEVAQPAKTTTDSVKTDVPEGKQPDGSVVVNPETLSSIK